MRDPSAYLVYLEQTSYLGMFLLLAIVGFLIPIPEEIVLLLVGYLAASGINELWLTLLVAYAAVLSGDYLVFNLSRHGNPLMQRLGQRLKIDKQRQYHDLMQAHAALAIFVLKFAFGLRFVGLLLAGSLHVRHRTFLTAEILALALYIPLYVLLGYHFHDKFTALVTHVDIARHLITLLTIIAVGTLLGLWVKHRFLTPRRPDPPEEKSGSSLLL